MNDIKISVTMSIPGRQMYPEKECSKTIRKKTFVPETKKVFWKKICQYDLSKCYKQSIPVEKGTEPIIIYPRKCVPAHQTLNMVKEAYDYFIENVPDSFKLKTKKLYVKLNPEEKVKLHLIEICRSLGGNLESFHIFED